MIRILVVDDEEIMCNGLYLNLKEEGYLVERAYDAVEALEIVKKMPIDIVITDLKLGDEDGIELIKKIREINPDIYFVLMTAYATVEKALEAGKIGVYYFITKPFSMELVNSVIKKISEEIELKNENKALKKQVGKLYEFSNIIGKSEGMLRVFDIIEKVSKINVTVLITGESGTGKELVANAIHYNSPRKNKPLVKINCAAMPEALLESELFGYEKGAFTGADSSKKGKFELADGGTIFLDEIGEMPLNLQAKLLRVLQYKTVEPLGSVKSIKVDVRIIAATNRELEKMVEEGKFRQDLYYRLKVVEIKLPPLRERKEDIKLLTEYFVKKYSEEFGKEIEKVSNDVYKIFYAYDWPGNVRELENVIQHAVIFADGPVIDVKSLPDEIKGGKNAELAVIEDKTLAGIEKFHIRNILEETGYNISKAAKILDIDRKTLYNKMNKYGLQRQK